MRRSRSTYLKIDVTDIQLFGWKIIGRETTVRSSDALLIQINSQAINSVIGNDPLARGHGKENCKRTISNNRQPWKIAFFHSSWESHRVLND